MARINRDPVFAEYTADTGIDMFIETEIVSVDCIANHRNIKVSLIAVNNTGGEKYFNAGQTSIYIPVFESSEEITEPFTLAEGETVILSCTANGVYDTQSLFMTVELGHTCAEAGFTESLSESRGFTVGKLVTGISVSLTPIDNFLGDKIYLENVVLDDGYDAWADIIMNNKLIETVAVDKSDWSIYLKYSWAENFPNKTYSGGKLYIWASCNGQPLLYGFARESVYNLRKEDGIPIAELDISTSSDNAAVQAFGQPIRNKSTVALDARGCEAKYGASIVERYIVLDGQRIDTDILTTDILTEAAEHTCSVTVVDSRGLKNSVSGSFEVLDYAPPTAQATVLRCDESGTPDKIGSYIIADITCSELYRFDGVNESYLFYTLRRKTGSGEVSDEQALAKLDAPCILALGLEIDASYELKLICRDDFGGETVYTFDLDCARVELNLAKDRVAVGKYAVRDKLFDCAWPARINGDITFTDESENEISLRSALLSGDSAVRFKRISADGEEALEAALSQENDGLCIVLASLPQEKRAYLLYKIGDESGRLKLFCE